jgi:PAT family beta-lactamase induction signal transducer AmpG
MATYCQEFFRIEVLQIIGKLISVSRPVHFFNMKNSRLLSFLNSFKSWRTASVSLLSFSSGLPLGLVWIAIPDWMRSIGVDIKLIGLFSLIQLPWSLKYIWSPIMDRYTPPFLGRRRGWTLIAQVLLLIFTLCLAGVGSHPDAAWMVGVFALAIAIASATQDIAVDAYTVDVLHPDEYGTAVGTRTALYRLAMMTAGGLAISLAGRTSWSLVFVMLASVYLLMMFITIKAPEPEEKVVAPQSLKDAVWLPFLGFLAKHRSVEILIFITLYKFSDNMAGSLLQPFLVDMGYSSDQRGLAIKTVGVICILAGTFLGGFLTTLLGLGHCLWLFGFLQIFSNIGYVFLSTAGVDLPLFYGALGFETFTQGLGAGSFGVFLLRLTQKRFSATQYALFTSMFALTRVMSGVISGFTVDSLGWTNFYIVTMVIGIPGMIILQRFSPLGVRDPNIELIDTVEKKLISKSTYYLRIVMMSLITFIISSSMLALLNYSKLVRAKDLTASWNVEWFRLFAPVGWSAWVQLLGILIFTVSLGLCTAAYLRVKKKIG